MRTVYWDIETRSAVSLREAGAHVYAIDPTTQVLCLVFVIDNEELQLWLPTDPPPTVFLEAAANPSEYSLVAHNYEFERAILENILVPRHGFRPIELESQHCSQRLALANAYPAELDLLAQSLGLPYRKDPAARKAMLAVSRPKAQRKRRWGPFQPGTRIPPSCSCSTNAANAMSSPSERSGNPPSSGI
jgi:DNA polymerase